MVKGARAGTLYLLAGVAICVAAPVLARSDPVLYTGSVQLRLWERQVPYGASMSGPGLGNTPSGDLVSLAGTGPAAFTLPLGQLSLMTSLFDASPPYSYLDFRSTRFSGANDDASFFWGGGPGPTEFTPLSSIPASQFGVSFSGEPDRFGGVMKLLGRFDWRGDWIGENCSVGICAYHTVIPLSAIGGPFGGTATATTYVGGSFSPPTLVTATVWGFPWDTGNVGAVAAVMGTASSTSTSAIGADLRSVSGLGTLQLVSPFLVRVKSRPPFCGGCVNQWFYGGTAHAELRFVPETRTTLLLAAGLSGLALLFRLSLSRSRTFSPRSRSRGVSSCG